jgi:hypothetical protein
MAYKAQQILPGELTSERRLRESVEGGPGSGPRKLSGDSPKSPKKSEVKEKHAHVRSTERHYAASSGKSSEMSKSHKAAMDSAIKKSRDLRGESREASNTYGNHALAMRLLDKAEKGMDKAWGAHADAYNQKHWGTKNPD